MRKVTNLRLKIYNETRWSRKRRMLRKWLQISNKLIEKSGHSNSNNKINDSNAYRNRVTKFVISLEKADNITVAM